MHHQTLQLAVYDPLGFDDYRTFTDQVATAIGDNTNVAPLPLKRFSAHSLGGDALVRP